MGASKELREELLELTEAVASSTEGWPSYCAELLAIGLHPDADPWRIWQTVTAPHICRGEPTDFIASLSAAYAAALVGDRKKFERFAKMLREEFMPPRDSTRSDSEPPGFTEDPESESEPESD